jgi:hypothetical protein
MSAERILVCFFGSLTLVATLAAQRVPKSAVSGHSNQTAVRTEAAVSAGIAATILAHEKAVWEAAKQGDMDGFRKLVADDARMIFSSGIRTRQEYIESTATRQIKSYSLDDFQVFLPAPNTAIAIYKATISGVFAGKDVPATTVREASVWIKRGGRWVAVLNQETPMPAM